MFQGSLCHLWPRTRRDHTRSETKSRPNVHYAGKILNDKKVKLQQRARWYSQFRYTAGNTRPANRTITDALDRDEITTINVQRALNDARQSAANDATCTKNSSLQLTSTRSVIDRTTAETRALTALHHTLAVLTHVHLLSLPLTLMARCRLLQLIARAIIRKRALHARIIWLPIYIFNFSTVYVTLFVFILQNPVQFYVQWRSQQKPTRMKSKQWRSFTWDRP